VCLLRGTDWILTIIQVNITFKCLLQPSALSEGRRRRASEEGVGDSVNISNIQIVSLEMAGEGGGAVLCPAVYDVCLGAVIIDGRESAAIPMFASPSVRSDRQPSINFIPLV